MNLVLWTFKTTYNQQIIAYQQRGQNRNVYVFHFCTSHRNQMIRGLKKYAPNENKYLIISLKFPFTQNKERIFQNFDLFFQTKQNKK